MKKLIDRLQKLPEEEQDKYAATYLQELEDDQRWEELFDRTTDEQWERLIQEARKGTEEDSISLDEFLNIKRS